MPTTTPVPAQHLVTRLGEMTASCRHPRRIVFRAGDSGTRPVSLEGHNYLVNLSVYLDDPAKPFPGQSIPLLGNWIVGVTDAALAIKRPNGTAPVLGHDQVFLDTVLPDIASWLATPPAAALLVAGTERWTTRALHDLDQAHAYTSQLRDLVARGETLDVNDERFLRFLRAHLPTS